MLKGLYISAVGMQAQMNRMDILSNNLANVDTAAFKRDATALRSFTDELAQRLHAENNTNPVPGAQRHHRPVGPFSSGVFVDEVYTDFLQGRLRETGDQFSAAIDGGGFFTVSVPLPSGDIVTRYTRDGNFTLNSQGMLVTKDGGMVLAQGNQPVYIPQGEGETTIDRYGNISLNGDTVARLMLTDFNDYTTLRKVGNNYYDVTPQTEQIEFTGTVVQGYIEDSNINAIREMVEIINTARIYEANSKFVSTIDQTLNKAANEVGRK